MQLLLFHLKPPFAFHAPNYQKSDHPLMDALDKSIQLGNAIEKLSNIPGFSKLTTVLDKKAKKIIQEQTEKVERGLGVNEEDDEDDGLEETEDEEAEALK
jgi:hypothetical protein